MVDIEKLLFAFAIEYGREILMAVTAVGSAAAAALPKIDPVILSLVAGLLVARGDIDFPNQSDMRRTACRSDVLVNLPVMVEGSSNSFHSRRHPLHRADV